MTFDDLKLLMAISQCGALGVDPVSDAARLRVAKRVRDRFTDLFADVRFPWTTSQVIELVARWRKSRETKLKGQIAMRHGYQCFWADRGKGPCDDQVEAGHVIPRSSGADLTVPNGMIECRAHNNQRRARTIEEYLASEDQTQS